MRKVAFLINSLTIGGAERVFIAQAEELARRGVQADMILLFSRGALADGLTLPGERVHLIGASSVFDLGAYFRLHKLLKSLGTDTLYTTLNEANFVGRFIKLLSPHLVLYTREANVADIKPLLYKLGDALLGFLSKKIVVVSKAVGASLLSYAPWLGGKIVVLYNGVRLPSAPPTREAGTGARLLAVGTLMLKKDFAVLIRALALLPEPYTLTLVGDGGIRKDLEALAQGLGVAGRVSFLGWVPPQEVVQLYATHDAFVLPSKWEGCPNVVSEAQSFALPVVAFDIAGMSEFTDDTSGALVKERTPEALAAGIREVCESREQMIKKGAAGFARVKGDREYNAQLEKFAQLILS
jgi:glycosyltransferase involved in cell wall biosynthesis